MGASKASNLDMVNGDGEMRIAVKKYFYEMKRLQVENAELKKEIETLKNDRDEYKKGM